MPYYYRIVRDDSGATCTVQSVTCRFCGHRFGRYNPQTHTYHHAERAVRALRVTGTPSGTDVKQTCPSCGVFNVLSLDGA